MPTIADNLEWANVPDPKDVSITYDAETDSVVIYPYSYYVQIIEYIIDTETNKKTLYGDELKKHQKKLTSNLTVKTLIYAKNGCF